MLKMRTICYEFETFKGENRTFQTLQIKMKTSDILKTIRVIDSVERFFNYKLIH